MSDLTPAVEGRPEGRAEGGPDDSQPGGVGGGPPPVVGGGPQGPEGEAEGRAEGGPETGITNAGPGNLGVQRHPEYLIRFVDDIYYAGNNSPLRFEIVNADGTDVDVPQTALVTVAGQGTLAPDLESSLPSLEVVLAAMWEVPVATTYKVRLDVVWANGQSKSCECRVVVR